jgi:hypothetical protein
MRIHLGASAGMNTTAKARYQFRFAMQTVIFLLVLRTSVATVEQSVETIMQCMLSAAQRT